MSRLRANLITNQSADGAPTVSNGLVISGVTTTSEIFVGTVIKLDPVSGIVTATGADISGNVDVAGELTVADMLGHTGDTHTKLSFPANDTIAFTTGGSERLRITSGGHISQGGGADPATSNGAIGLTHGIKADGNCVFIGETTVTTEGRGLQLEARQTGRSGNARIAQIGLRNDASGNGQITFWTSPSGADVTQRMNIDSSGNVTKPTSFHILVKRSGNQTNYNASNTTDPVIWNSVVTGDSSPNASSHFNTSTGLFTAPVTGLYFFHTAVNSPNITCQGGWLIINGSRVNYSAFNPNSAQTADATITYHVTAGETVGVKWYHNGQTNGTINANDHHTWWRIVLLG